MDRKIMFSTKAVIIKDDKFLVLYKLVNGKKMWDLPGGRMEFGESAEETLAREVMEELSVKVEPIKLIDTWNYMHNENLQITGIFYHCDIQGGEITLSEEHDGYEWVNIRRISETFTPYMFLERMETWDWDKILEDNRGYVDTIKEVEIDSLIPNNLFMNGDKIRKVEETYRDDMEGILPPVLVGIIDGELSLIDGHSRTWVAYKNGRKTIRAIVKPIDEISGSEKLYRKIHGIAKSEGLESIRFLEDRILSGEEHRGKWIGFCEELLDELG